MNGNNFIWSPQKSMIQDLHYSYTTNQHFHPINRSLNNQPRSLYNQSGSETYYASAKRSCTSDNDCQGLDNAPNWYCNTTTNQCNECNKQNTNWMSVDNQCSTMGNNCVWDSYSSEYNCKCHNWDACDATSSKPTCSGNGCVPCSNDNDCPNWRPKCIDSNQDCYNTATNNKNYKGYCCPTGDPNSCCPSSDNCGQLNCE